MSPRNLLGRLEPSPRPVELRFISHDLPVELYGDFVHWYAPRAMERSEAATKERHGEWQTTLRLLPGVYAYKFRTYDGAWHLDRDNPRTRSQDGCRNSLLVLGGSDEPVLHAPCFPLAFLEADGRLCLRAGLRRGAGQRLILRCIEPAGPPGSGGKTHDLAMRRIAEEDEHLLFEAHVPAAAPTLDYLFVLESGLRIGSGGQALHVRLASLRPEVPAWWRHAVLYTVFLDRFRRGGRCEPAALVSEFSRFGGDLDGVREALPYLSDLGVTVLHLTPVALSYSAHRYDAVNPRAVDPALGGEAALAALLEAAHAAGLRILLDVVLTHVHRDFLPFCEVRLLGPASPHAAWFNVYRHPFFEGLDPGYRHYQKGQWQEPLLATDHEEVVEYLEDVIRHYASLGVDGFRLDAAADVPLELLLRLRAAARSERPDAVLFGEITPNNIWRYTSQALDAATDFAHQQAIYDWLWHRRIDARAAAARLARAAFSRGPDAAAVVFTATHDQPRFLTLVQDARRARLAHFVTLLGAAIPAIYYGDEVGLRSSEPDRAFEDAWPDRAPMPWPAGQLERAATASDWDEGTLALFRAALHLRRSRPALHRGSAEFLDLDPAVLAFRRQAGEDLVEVYANGGELATVLPLPAGPSSATLLLAAGEAALDGDCLRLGPLSAAVVARHIRRETAALVGAALAENAALCAAAFRAGQTSGLWLPTHLYLTVTERCNLRCRHCITFAPARTADGSASTLRPWLLEALAEAFAAASYFGFVHGGESLVAPIFFDVLDRIKSARAGRPYDVHLLSNGMRLDEPTVERLCELGVTSLAVSLDGGSAATNDSLRLGADFERILHNLAAALALRSRLGADLRIGVSTVVTSNNVAELVQLGQRLAAIGIDWLKVEEMYPVNALSRRERLEPQSPAVLAAMQALRGVLDPAGVVVVDHLAPPAGCPCQADGLPNGSSLQEFRATDDFANRTCFLPCRAAWQQACVDPDGTVHAVDYFQPPLGSLAEAPLLALWHGERAQRQRAMALRSVAAEMRTRCTK